MAVLSARWDWRADLFTHFQAPALAATILAAVGLRRRHRRLSAVMALLAVVQFEPLSRFDGPNPVPPDPASPDRLRIISANVLEDNDDADRLIRLIREERPDVIGL